MAELVEVTGTEYEPTLSAEESGLAKANLRFALENCPVDGGILTEDGSTSSRESVEALLERLESVGATTIKGAALSGEELNVLRAVADFALDGCPIESGMTLDDGRPVSKTDLRALREKIGILTQAVVPE